MSDWLKKEQQGLVNDNPTSTNENCSKKQADPFKETAVTVNLVDCMKCFVRIPRCQIEEQNNCSKTDTKTMIEQQIRERYEEEEK